MFQERLKIINAERSQGQIVINAVKLRGNKSLCANMHVCMCACVHVGVCWREVLQWRVQREWLGKRVMKRRGDERCSKEERDREER